MKEAVFFVYVWPEPQSSAAGVRTRELMEILLGKGWSVAAVSPSGASPHRDALEALGVRTLSCDPNDSASSDPALASLHPDLVVFDRFVMEEQFGWRARGHWPQAFFLVDTQDLHSLRRARERLARSGAAAERIASPRPEDMGEDLLRELASLYRADGALVVSGFERELLLSLGYPAANVFHLPFSTEIESAPPGFSPRKGFAFLGNFRHAPNLDSALHLTRELWPQVRARLPAAELHLYGAYPPAEISLHQGANGIFAHGPVRDHRGALARHRALLAPLRFGAGIKGKVLEAFGTGTPALGSALAFEGIGGGVTYADEGGFFDLASRLHEDEAFWTQARDAGLARVKAEFSRARVARDFLRLIEEGQRDLGGNRARNLTGAMLRHHLQNSTKYFSRWIEAKNQRS